MIAWEKYGRVDDGYMVLTSVVTKEKGDYQNIRLGLMRPEKRAKYAYDYWL